MMADENLWVTFHALHMRLLLDDVYAVWVSPLPAETHNNDSLIDDRAGGVLANGGAGRCRHPFGRFTNPQRRCGRRMGGLSDVLGTRWIKIL